VCWRASAVAVALFLPVCAAAQEADTYRELLLEYRCPVVDRLQQIYAATDSSNPQNWFLIVYFAAQRHDYVQCVFDPKTYMFCEAASGFYDNVATQPRTRWLSKDAVAALGRLGFSTDDTADNFRIGFDVADPPDFNRIAEFILKALHDGFGARANDTLEFNAPLAPHATSKCDPVS
jgi:hypothetical protein